MITKFGRIEISKLHALMGQQSPEGYTVPAYARLREGASKRAIMLERQHGLEQGQRVTNWNVPLLPRTLSTVISRPAGRRAASQR